MQQISAAEINKLMTDIYNAFCRLPLTAGEFLYEKISEKMGERNNSSLYCYKVFKELWSKAIEMDVNVSQASILEIGAGKYTSVDKFIEVNLNDLWLQRFQSFIDLNLYNPSRFRIDSIIQKQNGCFYTNPDRLALIQALFEEVYLKDKSFNYVYSLATLEHVVDVSGLMAKMHRIMADGAVGFHIIDLREHHTNLRQVPDKNTSIDFMKYSKAEWEEKYPPGSPFYINRLRASDFRSLFERSGFDIVDFEVSVKMNLDDRIYRLIHPEFHHYALEDLETLGVRIACRKKETLPGAEVPGS
jgi:hypothetical protein